MVTTTLHSDFRSESTGRHLVKAGNRVVGRIVEYPEAWGAFVFGTDGDGVAGDVVGAFGGVNADRQAAAAVVSAARQRGLL